MQTVGCVLLLISGSLRAESTNTAVLRTAQADAPNQTSCVLYEELAFLPHFNPDDDVDPLHPAVARLRALVHESDALLISTPEYAGALPGSLKNLLEWLIGDDQPGSIYENRLPGSTHHRAGPRTRISRSAPCSDTPMPVWSKRPAPRYRLPHHRWGQTA